MYWRSGSRRELRAREASPYRYLLAAVS